jgi:hypothetical protein
MGIKNANEPKEKSGWDLLGDLASSAVSGMGGLASSAGNAIKDIAMHNQMNAEKSGREADAGDILFDAAATATMPVNLTKKVFVNNAMTGIAKASPKIAKDLTDLALRHPRLANAAGLSLEGAALSTSQKIYDHVRGNDEKISGLGILTSSIMSGLIGAFFSCGGTKRQQIARDFYVGIGEANKTTLENAGIKSFEDFFREVNGKNGRQLLEFLSSNAPEKTKKEFIDLWMAKDREATKLLRERLLTPGADKKLLKIIKDNMSAEEMERLAKEGIILDKLSPEELASRIDKRTFTKIMAGEAPDYQAMLLKDPDINVTHLSKKHRDKELFYENLHDAIKAEPDYANRVLGDITYANRTGNKSGNRGQSDKTNMRQSEKNANRETNLGVLDEFSQRTQKEYLAEIAAGNIPPPKGYTAKEIRELLDYDAKEAATRGMTEMYSRLPKDASKPGYGWFNGNPAYNHDNHLKKISKHSPVDNVLQLSKWHGNIGNVLPTSGFYLGREIYPVKVSKEENYLPEGN